ncbi:MAG: hypothetical protein DDT19_02704 [Syntrophomonadaceae bacterium]|nr:hypothetical protein [Bacillota bacterium]
MADEAPAQRADAAIAAHAAIVRLRGEDALHVALNMREVDRLEISATRWSESPWDFAVDASQFPGASWSALLDGEPVAIGGIALLQPGIGQAWMVGTDKLPQVGLMLTRFCRDVAHRMLTEDSGIHRIQAFSAGFHTEAHAWLRAVGLDSTQPLLKYGKGGEDFLLFYGLRKD